MKKKGSSLRNEQLAHIGKLMAGVSHDFKNHLAIIGELSGLLADLLLRDEDRLGERHGRYGKIIDSLAARVKLAAELCHVLSRFSHRMDEPLSIFQVNEVLEEEIGLLKKYALNHSVTLVPSFAAELPPIFSDPAMVQYICFLIIRALVEIAEKKDNLSIVTEQTPEGAARITLSLEGGSTEFAEKDWLTLCELLREPLERLAGNFSLPLSELRQNKKFTLTLSSLSH